MKAGYLKEFIVDFGDWGAGYGTQQRGNPLPLPLGVIEVIQAAPKGTAINEIGVLTVAPMENHSGDQPPEKKMKIS